VHKVEEYADVLRRLVAETVACTPPSWTRGTLTIVSDGQRLEYKLKNEDEPEKASLSDELRGLIDEMYVRMAQYGDEWTQAVITFEVNGDDVKFDTAYTYADDGPAPPAPPPKKPWWRFGF
jgi:hypothetical protein